MNAENRLKYLKAADKFFRSGKTELAISEYQKILEIKPDDLEIRRIIGDLHLKLNQNQEALKHFEWIADYYLKEGFFTKAIAMYKRITRLDPQSEEISYKLADLYSRQGLIIEAKQIYLELAEEYKRQNNQKKALGIYKKILEFDRGNVKMRLLLADNYLKESMTEEAISEYLIASDIHLKKKEYKAAEDILNETLAKINHPKVFDKLISCLIAQGEDKRAIQLMQGMGAALFQNINLLKTLAELYLKNNQVEEAEKIYQKVTEIDPSETEVIVRLGKVYLQREEFDRVFNLFLPTIDTFA
ncbi:MAG TPA: tetratricopeptide repeat protein, partial [Candidatus Aminicenantes bacterium]|nr:tetratricopeptide repeat protein [Candidatus Aminicenantes bacterium]